MRVDDLLNVYCGEDLSSYTEWERMGQSYKPTDIQITEDFITQIPFTNLFSFPEISECRVYHVKDYTKVARWIWSQIRLANRPARNFQEYIERVTQLKGYDFICWYQHHYLSTSSTFEDRVFIKCIKKLRSLRSLYHKQVELEPFIDQVKDELLLKSEKFSVIEDTLPSK
jgi:hypothetical protein